ncbi:MAG: phosphate acetyltransferase [Clostridiales bacterium]|nr:phosphate acetyltransferase [Clostridiales bacterium]
MNDLLNSVREKAKALKKTIVLAEGEEPRIITAAAKVQAENIAKIVLIGNPKKIAEKCPGANLNEIKIIDTASVDIEPYAQLLYELRKAKGMDIETARKLAANPLYFGVLMVKRGEADGMVAGSINATGDVLRPALQIIKTAPGIKTVSSCFIMCLDKNSKYGEKGIMVFGDCAVNPNPDSQQLADIAIASADSATAIAGISPKVALLSFSTKGSAKSELVDKVTAALDIVKKARPDLAVDGELQADAALVPTVADLKAPGSTVAGKANVLIFPDLQAGNIGYKLVQRLAGAEAIGPICQGFNKPVNDLSRGCSSEDVVNVVAMTALQSAMNK